MNDQTNESGDPRVDPRGDPRGDPQQADAASLVEALRVAMLTRMMAMWESLPDGYYTEIKGQLCATDGMIGTFKLRDFAASLKDVSAIGSGSGSGTDIEDCWGPLAEILGDTEEDDDDEEED